jgi:hypothetical protein
MITEPPPDEQRTQLQYFETLYIGEGEACRRSPAKSSLR